MQLWVCVTVESRLPMVGRHQETGFVSVSRSLIIGLLFFEQVPVFQQ